MRRAALERQAIALRSSTDSAAVLDAVLPGLSSEPRLVRTRALEVAVEAALDAPDRADSVGAELRDALEAGPPLSTREIELLLPLARERPRALADCLQPLLDVLAGTDAYDDEERLVDDSGPDRRKVAAGTVLVAAVDGAPGLFQGAVPTLLELADTESAVGRRCLWALARLAAVEPATVRPVVADAVWTIEDGSGDDRIGALDRLSTIGRVSPDALPPAAVSAVASVAAEAESTVRVHAFCTLAAIGGRPSDALRRHAVDFDDIDDLFLGNRPALTDELVGDEPTPPGRPADDAVSPHRTVVLEALQAEDPAVVRAAQDAAIALGRESPEWLRSRTGTIRTLLTADSPLDREAAASLLQRAVRGAPPSFLRRAFVWLRRLVGDSEGVVPQRAVAALGTLLSELLDRESGSAGPSVAAVWETLVGRYVTAPSNVRDVIVDAVEPVDLDALPPRAIDAAVDGLLTRVERVGAVESTSDEGLEVVRAFGQDRSVDAGEFTDLLEFSARLLDRSGRTDRRLASALAASLNAGNADHEQLFGILPLAEPSLRRSPLSLDDTLETAYQSPDEFDAEDLRESVLDAVQSLDSVDPAMLAGVVEDATLAIPDGDTPYWTAEATARALERVLLAHPAVAERVREALLAALRTADEERGAVARVVATAYLAAPPREPADTDALASLLGTVDGEPAVESWLAAALVVLAPDEATRSRAVERLRSLRVRGDRGTFGTALGVACAATGSLPDALSEPLLAGEPATLFEALERLPPAPGLPRSALDDLLPRVVVGHDPAARAELPPVLEALPPDCRSTLASTIRQRRVCWFLTGEDLRSALRLMRADELEGGRRTDEGSPTPFETHPDAEVRALAADRPPAADRAESSVGSAYRLRPLERRVERDAVPGIDAGLGGPGSPAHTEQLVRAVRHGGPATTVAGLEAIRRGLDRGAVDWQQVENTVTDHLTDRWRVVRRRAARVVLRATWAGSADPDPAAIADRLVTDEAARGVLAQVLLAADSDPEHWPAPTRLAAVFVDLLLSGASHSERHAAGRGLVALVGAVSDPVRETVTDGVRRLTDDGVGDTLAAYYLLAAVDRLVDEHGDIADEFEGYLETVLTSDSIAGIPTHDGGRTLGPVTPEAAPPVDRLAVYRIAAGLAAHGGLRAYRGVLDPPNPLETDDVLTVEGVVSFLRNASDDAVQEIGTGLLDALPSEALADLIERWLAGDDARSPALAARRVAVVPLLARATEGAAAEPGERPRFVDFVVDELTAADSAVRVAAVTALSELTAAGHCPPDELVAHLLGRAGDPSGWVRRGTAEALAEHAPAGDLTGDWLHRWAERELASPRDLRARTAAMLVGALGVQEPSLRRQCVETAATALPTGRTQLDDRLASAISRLLDRSPVLEDSLDAETLARLDRTRDQRRPP